MYNDTIKVANKIISDTDLFEIFDMMNNELEKYRQLCRQETMQNEKYEREYQHWTVKNFDGEFKCTINFYDDTNITFDNYNNFIGIFNNRLHEIKDLWIRYNYSYWIQNGTQNDSIHQHINMTIYENKMDIDVNLSSADKKMDDVYTMIKNKILAAPERYDRIVKKKSSISNKVAFASGIIPAMVILACLAFIPVIRQVYGMTFVLYPIGAVILGYMIGGTLFGGHLDKLYSTIVPEKKYAGYDTTNHKSIYTDDVDSYINKSEIIIGKNIDNIKNRKEIAEIEEKYSSKIPTEIIALLVISVIMILIGRFI